MAKYILTLLFFLTPQMGYCDEVFFKEDFNNLEDWSPLYFPKIEKYSSYIIESDSEGKYLKAQSNASASAIIHKKKFDVYKYPRIRWRWKVKNVYKNGDAKTKAGDDFPLRVYVMFKYDPKHAGLVERVRYKSLKLIYGEYPPQDSLDYIWANKEHQERIIPNPYNDKSEMVLLQKGVKYVGRWLIEDINIIDDYKKAFGKSPPAMANIAVMNDSDDTGESSVSYLDYIQVYKKEKVQNSY